MKIFFLRTHLVLLLLRLLWGSYEIVKENWKVYNYKWPIGYQCSVKKKEKKRRRSFVQPQSCVNVGFSMEGVEGKLVSKNCWFTEIDSSFLRSCCWKACKGEEYGLVPWVNLHYFLVSSHFGFGLMDASTIIEYAKGWHSVPEQLSCEVPLNVSNVR